jgi:hypothetical protein
VRAGNGAHCLPAKEFALMSLTYYITRHAALCPTSRYWVVLDAQNDAYMCIPRRAFGPLVPLIHGLKHPPVEDTSDATAIAEADTLAKELVAKGILSKQPAPPRSFDLSDTPTPQYQLNGYEPQPSTIFKASALPAFWRACAEARAQLRHRNIAATLDIVTERKHSQQAGRSKQADCARLSLLVRTFLGLRLLFPHPCVCLFDSLALLNFLARYRLFPVWVFGVVADPFEAHCWLQHDETVLNDSVSRVRGFVPILAV